VAHHDFTVSQGGTGHQAGSPRLLVVLPGCARHLVAVIFSGKRRRMSSDAAPTSSS
jgi:hypothetical protein